MRKVASDLQDRFVVEVDPTAEPADWDLALARFLLRVVRKQAARSAGTAAAVQATTDQTGGTTDVRIEN